MTKLRLALLESEDFSRKALDLLRGVFDLSILDLKHATVSDLLKNYDILWFRFGLHLSADLLSSFSSVRTRALVVPVTCANHIDAHEASRLGLEILTLQGEREFLKEVRATAELSLGLMLSLLRHIPASTESTRGGHWNRDLFRGREIYQKTVGLVGVGRLGEIVGRMLVALGARVLGFDKYPRSELNFLEWRRLDDLLRESDIISLHLSLTKETENFFNADCFAKMKAGAYFINTARGDIVDENALLQSLESGHLAGAALDVLAHEGRCSLNEHPLIAYARRSQRLMITPHIGGNTVESFEKTELFMAQKVIRRFQL